MIDLPEKITIVILIALVLGVLTLAVEADNERNARNEQSSGTSALERIELDDVVCFKAHGPNASVALSCIPYGERF